MSVTKKSYQGYREVQQIWDPHKADLRVREACTRCRERRAKCDGRRPCRRCRRVQSECVYSSLRDVVSEEVSPAEQQMKKELLHDLSLLQQLLDKLGLEIEETRARISVVPMMHAVRQIKDDCGRPVCAVENQDAATRDEDVRSADEAESGPNYGNLTDDVKSWQITLTTAGVRIQTDITAIQQLQELLKDFMNSSTIYREPATAFSTIGTQAMMLSLSVQWYRWHNVQPAQFQIHIPNPPLPQIFTPVITEKMEQVLLDHILQKTVESHPAFRKKFGDAFLSRTHNKRPQSPHYIALAYAIGAFSAQHTLLNHFATAANSSADLQIQNNDFGWELAERYFLKARELLIDQFLTPDPGTMTADTVDALHALVRYKFHNGEYEVGMCYLEMAIRVATQLNYHQAMRDPSKTDVDAFELENAILWNHLVCTDQAFSCLLKISAHTTVEDTRLNLFNVTLRIPPEMSEERRQQIYESFHTAKNSAICRDIFDTWWGDSASDPTSEDLDRFIEAFDCWAHQLPPSLRVIGTPFSSRSCFSLAINVQLVHQMSLVNLYLPFLPSVHRNPSSLPIGLPQKAERAYSKATIMSTQFSLTYLKAGGCAFPPHYRALPFDVFSGTMKAHMRLAKAKDDIISTKHRAYVAKGMKLIRGLREYELGQTYFVEFARFVEDFMELEGIEPNADLDLDPEDYFVPVRVPGAGW
ncbi:hypothetical protein BC938DRAFT_484020 [Jimgerdemannia flammicorona]|uniref:Zn(2)-C6 fungal-type domain-containing protein n=1 Tax=Jimgerdemannia flammicorona TaxID=994334 RepID=A0A433R042_9FUNG|nr:hypothetical protein BC938DRAFT_484020 [Jimgerdemannia flammicorona]